MSLGSLFIVAMANQMARGQVWLKPFKVATKADDAVIVVRGLIQNVLQKRIY